MNADILLPAAIAPRHFSPSLASPPLLPSPQLSPLQLPPASSSSSGVVFRISEIAAPAIQAPLPPDPHGRPHALSDLIKRIQRGDSIFFNNSGLWESLKKTLCSVCEFFGIAWEGYLDATPFDGTYSSRSAPARVANSLLGYTKENDLRLVDFAVEYLNTYEQERCWSKGVGASPFNTQEMRTFVASIKERLAPHVTAENKVLKLTKMKEQRKEVRAKLRNADAVEKVALTQELTKLNYKLREAKKQAHAQLGIHRLDRHMLAFNDREIKQSEIARRGVQDNVNYVANKQWLTESLAKWKKGVKPVLANTAASIADENKKIEELLCYPDIIKLLKKDPVSRENIYKLVFRNMRGHCNDSIHIATQFPATSEEIATCFLDKREGRLGNLLTFSEEITHERPYTLHKEVRFKMNGTPIALNNRDQRIAFSQSYSASVDEILKSFARKNKDIGDFECNQEKGIMRMHPLPVDFDAPNWQENIPALETLTRAQLIERHGRAPQEAFIVIKASRQHDPKDPAKVRIDDTHAWLEVITPDRANPNLFNVYPFGKYADPMPQSFFDKIFFVFKTHLGALRFDENVFFNQRAQQSVVVDASMQETGRVFEKIKRDIKKERSRDLLFQAQGDNCAAWVIDTLNDAFQDRPELLEQLKDLYEVSWLQMEAPKPMSFVADGMQFVYKNISRVIGNIMRVLFGLIMGAWRGFSTSTLGTRRLTQHPNFLVGKNFIPAQLFNQATELNRRLAALPARVRV